MSWKKTCQLNGIAIAVLVLVTPVVWGEPVIARLDIYPADIQMTSSADTQRFIVVATRDDGVTLDVTKTASIALRPGVGRTQRKRALSQDGRPNGADGDVRWAVGHGRDSCFRSWPAAAGEF